MKRSFTKEYSFIQFVFALVGSSILGFSTVYLLKNGFNTNQIGIFISTANISVVIFQVILTRYNKDGTKNSIKIANIMILLSIISLLILLFQRTKFIILILFFLPYLISIALQANINIITGIIKLMEMEINIGISRIFAAVAFSLNTYFLSILIKKTDVNTMIYFSALFYLILFFSLKLVPKNIESNDDIELLEIKETSYTINRKTYITFICFCFGYACFCAFHYMKTTFLINIIENVNANIDDLGKALSIASLSEIPILLVYKPLKEKIGTKKILSISSKVFLLQGIILFFSRTILGVYIFSIIQGGAFGLMIPSSIEYINEEYNADLLYKFQSYLISATSLGVLSGTLLGGYTLDKLTYFTFKIFALIFVFIGSVAYIISFNREKI
ncbi:MFS transporter [Helcococcus kunzii]|uniref:MFS transporter n=1 Tax=Helcococcus kunzii TaxID=40091 RepID=UPI0024ACB159|nr:MFS transporter [Helcococcus kunzii]